MAGVYRAVVCAAAALGLVRLAGAQIPDGAYVVCATNCDLTSLGLGPGVSGRGGLYVVDPLTGAIQRVAGLSSELTGASLGVGSNSCKGSACVAIREDGVLYVGEWALAGESVDLHILSLSGLSVSQDLSIHVGTAELGGRIEHVRILRNGDAIVKPHDLVLEPPLQGAELARVSPAGQVTPIPITPPPTYMSAFAVDETESTIYYHDWESGSAASVYAVPIGGGVARLIGSYSYYYSYGRPVQVLDMVLHGDGWLYCVDRLAGIIRIDPATGAYEVLGLGGLTGSSRIAAERATGVLPYVQYGILSYYPMGGRVAVMSPPGVSRTLATIRGSSLTGIAVADNPRSRGAGYGGYPFEVSPSPGGLPRVGNTQFGLQLEAPGPTVPGALIASLGYASQPFVGIQLLLDPATAVAVGTMPASGVRPLPIPAVSALVGQTLWLQSFHLEPAGLRASEALQITVMP